LNRFAIIQVKSRAAWKVAARLTEAQCSVRVARDSPHLCLPILAQPLVVLRRVEIAQNTSAAHRDFAHVGRVFSEVRVDAAIQR
jgi:hypothetical protein